MFKSTGINAAAWEHWLLLMWPLKLQRTVYFSAKHFSLTQTGCLSCNNLPTLHSQAGIHTNSLELLE